MLLLRNDTGTGHCIATQCHSGAKMKARPRKIFSPQKKAKIAQSDPRRTKATSDCWQFSCRWWELARQNAGKCGFAPCSWERGEGNRSAAPTKDLKDASRAAGHAFAAVDYSKCSEAAVLPIRRCKATGSTCGQLLAQCDCSLLKSAADSLA